MTHSEIVIGRCILLEDNGLTLFNEKGQRKFTIDIKKADIAVGDIVRIKDGEVSLVTRNMTDSKTMSLSQRILSPRRIRAVQIRSKVEQGIRSYFQKRNFHEVKTPLLVKSPGIEPHIRPYQLTTGEFIPTSPEFAMKKLLAGGLENIFQICPAFRYEPKTKHHSPEFTILEWYQAHTTYIELMNEFESLVESLAIELFGSPLIHFCDSRISVKTPWPRLKVRDLFLEYCQVDLVANTKVSQLAHEARRLNIEVSESDSWNDIYFRIWLELIEPRLPKEKAVFVFRYPASQAALSIVDKDQDGSLWARRFEPYIGGLELGNAYEELTDSEEQMKRFNSDLKLIEKLHGESFPKSPVDDEFILALKEGMPPSSGIAVGVDRLVMLFANEPDIDFTMWLPSYVASN